MRAVSDVEPGRVRVVPSIAQRAAGAVNDDRLATESLDSILESLLAAHGPEMIDLDVAGRWYTHDGPRITLHYPFVGTADGLRRHAPWIGQWESTPRVSGVAGSTKTTAHLVLGVNHTDSPDFGEKFAEVIAEIDAKMVGAAADANSDIAQEQAQFIEEARGLLAPRWQMVRAIRGGMALANIPMQRPTADRIEVPLRPTQFSMTLIEQAATTGASEFKLADAMAESVVETIVSFSRALERLPGTTAKLLESDEESLRDVLLFVLNANFQGAMTGETFIGRGKADLLLRWRDRDAFVGECKIWNGPAKLSEGVDQLLDRYTLWRQTRIALVVFFRGAADATKLIDSAHAKLAQHPRVIRTVDASEPYRRGEYEVQASGDERRLAQLTFLPVVISA